MFQGIIRSAVIDWLAIAVFLLSLQVTAATEGVHERRKVVPRDNQYCGIDSLYVFLKTARVQKHSLSQLEQFVPPTHRGVSVANIVKYCNDNAIGVSVMRTTLDNLQASHLPAILHVNGNHFLTIVATEDDRLVVFDNAFGLFDCSVDWFAEHYTWDGLAIVHRSAALDILRSRFLLSGTLVALAVSFGALWHFRGPHGRGAPSSNVPKTTEG